MTSLPGKYTLLRDTLANPLVGAKLLVFLLSNRSLCTVALQIAAWIDKIGKILQMMYDGATVRLIVLVLIHAVFPLSQICLDLVER